jgi:surfeit locus 1 family protein
MMYFSYTGKNFSEYIIYLDGNYQTPRPKIIDANISNNHKKYALTWFSLAISNSFIIFIF